MCHTKPPETQYGVACPLLSQAYLQYHIPRLLRGGHGLLSPQGPALAVRVARSRVRRESFFPIENPVNLRPKSGRKSLEGL
jgi:hypothetical protein